MYVDGIKVLEKNEKVLDILTQKIRIYSQDIEMELKKVPSL